jgi:hypothetical protein
MATAVPGSRHIPPGGVSGTLVTVQTIIGSITGTMTLYLVPGAELRYQVVFNNFQDAGTQTVTFTTGYSVANYGLATFANQTPVLTLTTVALPAGAAALTGVFDIFGK